MDPGVALGPGWHIPTSAEWINVINAEVIHDSPSAFLSNLKLTESGYRNSVNGAYIPNGVGAYYWSSSAANTNLAKNVFIDLSYSAINSNFIVQTGRGYGFNLRFVKN